MNCILLATEHTIICKKVNTFGLEPIHDDLSTKLFASKWQVSLDKLQSEGSV